MFQFDGDGFVRVDRAEDHFRRVRHEEVAEKIHRPNAGARAHAHQRVERRRPLKVSSQFV